MQMEDYDSSVDMNMSQQPTTDVLRPLLSLKTTGSISVERAAKPLKNGVASKDRNRLSHDKRLMCLKVGLNLNLKMRLHTEFVGKSDTSWNDLDEGCIV